MRLDFTAVRWCMDEHRIRPGEQLPMFRLVSLLHDVRWHRDRTIGMYCQAHTWDLDADGEGFASDCRRCRASLGIEEVSRGAAR